MAHPTPSAGGITSDAFPRDPDSPAASGADAGSASASDDQTAARRVAALAARGRDSARHLADRVGDRVGALPRLAAAGAARLRDRARRDADASAAERDAHRREAALAAAEEGAGTDWGQVGVFGAGIVVGVLIGAGAALLLAPSSGYETRARLASRARHSRRRLAGRADELGEDVRHAARRGKKRVGRTVTSSRWAAEDAWERRRARHDR